ncbi:MAG TPA: hypothetical protein VLB86_16140, partial [Gaiellaceae bacterium]|nr:hypothetical protein [Gaiellaceae bacterium]
MKVRRAVLVAALAAAALAPVARAEDPPLPGLDAVPQTAPTVDVAGALAAAQGAVQTVQETASAPVVTAEPQQAAPAPTQAPAPDAAPASGANGGGNQAPTQTSQPASTSAPAPDAAGSSNTATNSGQYQANTTQYQPTNIVVIVRINSPGDDGPITQTNTATAAAVGTTTQTVTQAVEAVSSVVELPSESPTLPDVPSLPSVPDLPGLPGIPGLPEGNAPPIPLPAVPMLPLPVPIPEVTLPALPALPALSVPVGGTAAPLDLSPLSLGLGDDFTPQEVVARPGGTARTGGPKGPLSAQPRSWTAFSAPTTLLDASSAAAERSERGARPRGRELPPRA